MDVGAGAHEAIKGTGHDERAVSVEVHCGDIVEVGVQCFGASTCVYSYRSISTPVSR